MMATHTLKFVRAIAFQQELTGGNSFKQLDEMFPKDAARKENAGLFLCGGKIRQSLHLDPEKHASALAKIEVTGLISETYALVLDLILDKFTMKFFVGGDA